MEVFKSSRIGSLQLKLLEKHSAPNYYYQITVIFISVHISTYKQILPESINSEKCTENFNANNKQVSLVKLEGIIANFVAARW